MLESSSPNISHSSPSDAHPETLRAISAGIAATCAGFNLRRASRAVTQHFDRALAPLGLRSTQFTILSATAIGGTVTTSQLAQVLVTDRTTLTRNLRLLRQAGLIEVAPRTGRQVRFQLTEAGRQRLAQALPRWRIAQEGIVQAFGEAAWPEMVQDLGRLVRGTLALGKPDAAPGKADAGREHVISS